MSEDVFEALGQRLRQVRLRRRLSLAEVAGRAGIAVARLEAIENGVGRVRGSELFDLAECLDEPYDHIFTNLDDSSVPRRPGEAGEGRPVDQTVRGLRVQRLIKRLAAFMQWS